MFSGRLCLPLEWGKLYFCTMLFVTCLGILFLDDPPICNVLIPLPQPYLPLCHHDSLLFISLKGTSLFHHLKPFCLHYFLLTWISIPPTVYLIFLIICLGNVSDFLYSFFLVCKSCLPNQIGGFLRARDYMLLNNLKHFYWALFISMAHIIIYFYQLYWA